jgi:hypothetical protein
MGKVDIIIQNETGTVASKIGKGIVAGIAGTIAITAAQMIEMKISGRKASSSPADAAGKVLGVEPAGDSESEKKKNKSKFSHLMHWAYGISWGIPRGLLSLVGVKGLKADSIEYAGVFGTAMIMLPSLEVSTPVYKWSVKGIVKEAMYHAVYAFSAGYVFRKLNKVKA